MSNMVVNTNVLALNSHRAMKGVGAKQATASARLSSGTRINSAADDAAGLAISEKMRAQIRGLDMASKNSQDAISLIQTAEGGMQEIDNMLQRTRELVVQASNDTNEYNIGSEDREKIQKEINQLVQEIDSMADRVEFNKKKVIGGEFADYQKMLADSTSGLTTAQASLTAAQTAVNGGLGAYSTAQTTYAAAYTTLLGAKGTYAAALTAFISAQTVFDAADSAFTTAKTTFDAAETLYNTFTSPTTAQVNAYTTAISAFTVANATYTTAQTTYNAANTTHTTALNTMNNANTTYAAAGTTFAPAKTTYDALVATRDAAQASVNSLIAAQTAAAAEVNNGKKGLYFQVGANEDQGMSLSIESVKSDKLGIGNGHGISNINVNRISGSDITGEIDRVDSAIAYVTNERAKLGAVQNRLEYTIKSLDISSENLSASESRIRDTDMAKEMMNLTKSNVLQQAATAMLSQANQAPQNVLQLLR